MSDNVDNLILEQLRAIRNEIREVRQVNTEEHNDLKARLAHIDAALLAIKRNDLETEAEAARQQISIDQIIRRIETIERRLELQS
jgi:hypothetical protein